MPPPPSHGISLSTQAFCGRLLNATLGADPREAAALVEAVALAADEVDAVVRVVVTLRDDFLGRLAVIDAMRAVHSTQRLHSIVSPLPRKPSCSSASNSTDFL